MFKRWMIASMVASAIPAASVAQAQYPLTDPQMLAWGGIPQPPAWGLGDMSTLACPIRCEPHCRMLFQGIEQATGMPIYVRNCFMRCVRVCP